jgi:hypothetical protein
MPEITLTADQIQNWRKTMFGMFGAAALILPDAEIQAFKDRMQAEADQISERLQSQPKEQSGREPDANETRSE